MELFVAQHDIILKAFKSFAFIGCLLLVILIAAFNSLYLSRILNTNKKIGLHPPIHIHHLIKVSIFIPLITALFIIGLLIFGFY